MDINKLIWDKYRVRQRLVEERDAEFITMLRSDKSLAKHIHFADGNVEKQREWIRHYKQREALGKEYYFIYESETGQCYGTTRLSDFDDHSCVAGSWLFLPESPSGLPIFASILTTKFAFDLPNIVYMRFDVRKLNKKVVRYNTTFWNLTKVAEDDLNNYYISTRENFNQRVERLIELVNLM